MIVLGMIMIVIVVLALGLVIAGSFFSQRYWKRVIADGDQDALRAALEEALQTWRRMRLPPDTPSADWAGLQSAAIVGCATDQARLSLVVGPDIRVIDGRREQVGPPTVVAERVAVKMVERLLYELPLARFREVQIDIYTEYRSPDGHVESDCLLTTRVDRSGAAVTDWDESSPRSILAGWRTREFVPGGPPLDPDDGALLARDDALPHPADDTDDAGPASREARAS